MTLATWNPATDFQAFRHEMDRMVNRLFLQGVAGVPGLPRLELARPLVPSIELYLAGETLVLQAELPGVSPAELTLEVSERQLTLVGEVRRDQEASEEGYYRSERRYGRFERQVSLPYAVKDAEARASFKHGVLTVRLPLLEPVEQPRARKVPIEQ